MSDAPRFPETPGDGIVPADRGSTGTPRWVKVFACIALLVALLVAIQLLAGGSHGPSRHIGGGHAAEHRAPSGGGHTP